MNVSEEPCEDVLLVLVTMNCLLLIDPRKETSATLQKSLITSETFPSCVGLGSTVPTSAHSAAIAKVDFPTPLLSGVNKT